MISALISQSNPANESEMMAHMQAAIRVRHVLMLSALALLGVALPGCGGQETIPDVEGIEVEMNTANFQEEVLDDDGVVFVDFWAPWCGPCVQLAPAVAYLSVEYKDRVKVGKVNVDENVELAQQYQVTAIPAFLVFQNGELVARRAGAGSYEDLSGWVDSQLGE